MLPDPKPVRCAVPGCALPAALTHDNVAYCVPCYRAHPNTILRSLGRLAGFG